jgi:FdhD protein
MKSTSVVVTRVTQDSRVTAPDEVALEEPLEISAAWQQDGEPREKTISVTMRTPSDDFDLAAGFLFSEGLIRDAGDIASVRHWGSPNKVRVALTASARIDLSKIDRHFYTTSSCGVCGKTSIDALQVASCVLSDSEPIAGSVIRALPSILRDAQSAFHETGGVHGAALIDRSGVLLCVREDIGRHNAVDKVIGSFVRYDPSPMRDSVLMVSSRGSFEIVQKAIVAGIPCVAFVGGPSSLAIDLARRFNVTLLGFVRDERFTVYTGEVRGEG